MVRPTMRVVDAPVGVGVLLPVGVVGVPSVGVVGVPLLYVEQRLSESKDGVWYSQKSKRKVWCLSQDFISFEHA